MGSDGSEGSVRGRVLGLLEMGRRGRRVKLLASWSRMPGRRCGQCYDRFRMGLVLKSEHRQRNLNGATVWPHEAVWRFQLPHRAGKHQEVVVKKAQQPPLLLN